MVTPILSANRSQTLTHSSNTDLSKPLKAIIVTVSVLAAALFGLWLAGQAGLIIGGIAGGTISFTAVRLCSSHPTPIVPQLTPGSYSLRDSTITWVTGTSSSTLALMLALHRLNKIPDFAADGPALIPQERLLERHIATLTNGMYFRRSRYEEGAARGPFIEGTRGTPEIAVNGARHPVESFNIHEALPRARYMPSGQSNISEDLYQLKVSVIRILQCGISDREKTSLRDHFQNHLAPLFSSEAVLRAHLFQSATIYCQNDVDRLRHDGETMSHFRTQVNELIALFDQVEPLPLTPEEQNLIDRPCPLVFASTNLIGEYLLPFMCYANERLAIREPALLGRDLQYVYTNAENIERIRRAVLPFGVREVRDLETLMQPR